jgi:hypothetical protein
MSYTFGISSVALGPNIAGEADGWAYKLWSFTRGKMASTDPFRSTLSSSPYTIVEASSGGTMNISSPNGTESTAFTVVCQDLFASMSKIKNKKK